MKNGGSTTIKATGTGLAGCLLCAAAWSDPVPSGPMVDYEAHCTWGRFSSDAACVELADRLAKIEQPSREERLALAWSLYKVGFVSRAAACAATEALVTEHPGYADALFLLSRCAEPGHDDAMTLLLRAVEIEPDNYRVLRHLTWESNDTTGIDPGTMAAYRESQYAAAKARVAWRRKVMRTEAMAAEPEFVWAELYNAARRIYTTALRERDFNAVEALQVRFRRDAGLDDLDPESPDSLALACRYPPYIGLVEVCISVVERVAERTSADGLPLPREVLERVERVTEKLRRDACASSMGQSRAGLLILPPGACAGAEATETASVSRLRAVLEHHGGTWSSEHHRVHAQGFLGDDARRDGLRAALRADPQNVRARCDLARALLRENPDAAADALGEGGDPSCLQIGSHIWGDRLGGYYTKTR